MVHQFTSIYVNGSPIYVNLRKWFIHLRQFTSIYVKFDICACPKFQGRVFGGQQQLREAHRPRGGGRDPKIDKNQQHPRDTCSKIPGACFFQKKKPLREEHRPRGGGRSP